MKRGLDETFGTLGWLVELDGFRMILDPNDENISKVLRTVKIWEPKVTDAVKQLLRRGDIFVSCGAHIGYYTCLAAHLVGPQGKVYAFEAWPKNFTYLHWNIMLNGLRNVEAYPLILSDRVEEKGFGGVEKGNTGGSRLDGSNEAPNVRYPAGRLDDYVPRADFLMVDCEGWDELVLRGGVNLLSRASTVIYESMSQEGVDWLRSQGFEMTEDLSSGMGPSHLYRRP